MRNKITFLCCVLVSVLLISCRVRDMRTTEIDVPQLRGEDCAQILHRVLATLNGVDGEKLHLEPGSVTVTYDSMRLALKNIEYTIAAAGFQANEIKPDPETRRQLPEKCR